MASAIGSAPPSPRGSLVGALSSIGRFGLTVLLVSIALSLLALPWVDLSWWKVVRRCVSIAAALSLWLCIRRVERRTLRSYGFADWGAGKRQLLFGLALGLGGLAVMLGLGLATGVCELSITPDRARLWRVVLSFIPGALLVAILEELVFRGFLLQHLAAWSVPFGVLLSSGLYALVHLKTTTLTLATGLELGGLMLLGVVLAMSYLVSGQLYLAVGLHAALAYGARVNKLVLAFPDPSLSWLVGSSRLVNGLVSWVALLGMGAAIVWWVNTTQQGGGHAHR